MFVSRKLLMEKSKLYFVKAYVSSGFIATLVDFQQL